MPQQCGNIMQPRGVTVAQVILVHFVEVRILTGLPFFCPKFGQKKVKSQDFSSRAVRRSSLKSRKAFLHIFTLPIEALLVKSFRFASLVKRSASHPVKLLPDGSKDGAAGKTHLWCLNNGKAAKTFFLQFCYGMAFTTPWCIQCWVTETNGNERISVGLSALFFGVDAIPSAAWTFSPLALG